MYVKNSKIGRLNSLFLVISSGFASVPVIANNDAANEGASEEIETVTVVGKYSESLARAVSLKRNNIAVTDSVVATDIADFPDQNLAEALQRIPGVAIERNKGMGTKVNVRSLGLEYTHTTINNVSTSSGSGGRDVNFDIFSSELIQSVTVKKSPVAADEEGGVAGVVAIRTAQPFDYSGNKFIFSSEAAYNDLSEKVDPRYSFLVSSNQDSWGALFSFAAEDRTVRTDQADTAEFKTLGSIREDAYDITYEDAIDAGMTEAGAVAAAEAAQQNALPSGVSESALYAENVRDDIILNDQEKWGATGAFQLKPNEAMTLSLDYMVGSFKGKEDDYLFGSWSGDATKATDLTIDDNGVVTEGTFEHTQHEFKSYDRYRDEDYQQASFTFNWLLNNWTIDTLVGFSKADRDYQRTQAKWIKFDSLTQAYSGSGMVRSSDNFNLATDVDDYTFVFWDFDNTKVEDEKWVYQTDFTRELNWQSFPALSAVQFGSRFSDKSMAYDHGWTEVQGETITQGEGGSQYTSSEWVGTPLPIAQTVSVNELIPGKDYMEEIPGKFDAWVVVPNAWARENYYIDGLAPNYFFNDHYQVDEAVLAFYAMADLSFELAGHPLDVNVGVRQLNTDQTSFGYQNVDGVWSDAPVKFEASYSDTLPSLNMSLSLNQDMKLRFAAAKVMSRASFNQLSGKRNISTNDRTIKMGNPDLDPLRASQMDLAYEWYFSEDSLFSLTGFYKDLKSFITEAKTGTMDYEGEEFELYSFVNGEGSTIKGLEFILQLPLSKLHPSLNGFGINANYTWVDSSNGHVSEIGLEVPMYGLSEDSYNTTIYYEKNGFDARLAYNFKGKSVTNLEDNLYAVYREDYGQYDLSASYAVNDNFKLTFKVINLTDEAISEYMINPEYPKMLQVSGRRISLGARFNF